MKVAQTYKSIQEVQQAVKASISATFPPIEQETRSHVETACCAFHMNRKDQTLRAWACLENGPIRPIRINGRLAWAVADIKRVLSEGA